MTKYIKGEGTLIGQIFKKMVIDCRIEMALYSKCVAARVEDDSLNKSSCEKEFLQMKECYSKIRRRR